jgi:hypothetical protein
MVVAGRSRGDILARRGYFGGAASRPPEEPRKPRLHSGAVGGYDSKPDGLTSARSGKI